MYLVKEAEKLSETSSTEFYCQYGDYFARFNSVKYTLVDFFSRAKRDAEVAKVILALQKKMKIIVVLL